MERVEWTDSGLAYAATWLDEETVLQKAKDWDGRVVTVGHVIYEDDTRLLMGLTHDVPENNWAGCFLIYKPCIIRRDVLLTHDDLP